MIDSMGMGPRGNVSIMRVVSVLAAIAGAASASGQPPVPGASDKKNPPSAGEIELGRRLFFDPRLSGNKAMSCATCHNPAMAWTDGLPRARGQGHAESSRNTPTLLNVHHGGRLLFWDGRAASVEEAVSTALRSRMEMNREPGELVRELNTIPDYAPQFVAVYGLAGITPGNIAKAIASFVRSQMHPGDTPFDRSRKDPAAMNEAQKRGLVAFTGKGRCSQCHAGPGFSDGLFHNTGLRPLPGVEDPGRHAVDPEPGAWRAFRTAPLRNVARTAPYMHDGSLRTLREVVDFYDRGGDEAAGRDPTIKPLGMTESEKSDLVAFLQALSAQPVEVAAPVLPAQAGPSSPEQGLAWIGRRLEMIDFNIRGRDREGVAANSAAVRDILEHLRRSPGAAAGCLAAADRKAWELGRAALSRSGLKALVESAAGLRASVETCRGAKAGGGSGSR